MAKSSDSTFSKPIDVVDSLAQQIFELTSKDELEVAISKHLGAKTIKRLNKEIEL